jgi:hypothetical protein
VALLLHYSDCGEQRESTTAEPPPWVRQQAAGAAGWPTVAHEAAATERLAKLRSGLLELERWLLDLVEQGLATVPQRPKRFWLDAAGRLVDVYAEPLAREVRDLAALPNSGAGWPERMVARLGLLFLLIQGFKRYGELSPATQADLLAAVGWQQQEMAAVPGEAVADRWLVLGRRQEVAERQRWQRIWLWGTGSGRFALLALRTPLGQKAGSGPGHSQGICLPTGLILPATVWFYPANWPLLATLDGAQLAGGEGSANGSAGHATGSETEHERERPAGGRLPGTASLEQAIRDYARARTANPWLRSYPLALQGVQIEREQERWWLRDAQGHGLALPPRFNQGWQLLALATAAPLTLFGEWNGAYLLPLAVYWQGEWRDLHRWRGIP